MRPREIGWSAASNALYDISKQLDNMIGISSKWLQGDFHQGALLNQVPFKDDALIWLDGTMSESNFIDKISGKLFPITGKDFDANWTRGFPWKSAATISAPANDAILIARDKNNYLYATDGTPNQIPIVSAFPDVDYDHWAFWRHIPQMIDANGVEVFEPRAADFVIYNTDKSGTDLVTCQRQFNVPAEDLTAKWVSKDGLDTNPGTKLLPWKTLTKVKATVISGTVYAKTNEYIESNLAFTTNSTLSLEAIGNCILKSSGVDYVLGILNSSGMTIKRLTLDGFGAENCISAYTGSRIIFRNCLIKNESAYLVIDNHVSVRNEFYDCIFNSRIANTANAVNTKSEIFNSCHFSNATLTLPVSGSEITAQITNCKFVQNKTGKLCMTEDRGAIIKGCLFYFAYMAIWPTSSINVTYCKFYPMTTSAYSIRSTATSGNVIVKYCTFKSVHLSIADSYFILGAEWQSWDIQHNTFVSVAKTYFAHIIINNTTSKVGRIGKINNNYHSTGSINGVTITLNGETEYNSVNDGCEIIGNTIVGAAKIYPNEPSTSCHSMLINGGKNIIVKYNHISYAHYGIVIKNGLTAEAYTDGGVMYNILEDCSKGIYVRGLNGLNIFGNTITHSSAVYGNSESDGIWVDENSAMAGTQNSGNVIIKNNIIRIAKATGSLIVFDQWAADHGSVAENNVLSGGAVLLAAGATNYTDLAAAQAVGKLLSCIVSDPLLNVSLIPTSPVLIGENLGATYEDGLDASTNWGSDSTPPVIVTKKHPAVGNWQVGAYVV